MYHMIIFISHIFSTTGHTQISLLVAMKLQSLCKLLVFNDGSK